MIDLDHFKQYNDSFGHPAGDEVLHWSGSILRAAVRAHDIVARYGGEEFVVLLPATDAVAAIEVAERLRSAIACRPWPHCRSPQAWEFLRRRSHSRRRGLGGPGRSGPVLFQAVRPQSGQSFQRLRRICASSRPLSPSETPRAACWPAACHHISSDPPAAARYDKSPLEDHDRSPYLSLAHSVTIRVAARRGRPISSTRENPYGLDKRTMPAPSFSLPSRYCLFRWSFSPPSQSHPAQPRCDSRSNSLSGCLRLRRAERPGRTASLGPPASDPGTAPCR